MLLCWIRNTKETWFDSTCISFKLELWRISFISVIAYFWSQKSRDHHLPEANLTLKVPHLQQTILECRVEGNREWVGTSMAIIPCLCAQGRITGLANHEPYLTDSGIPPPRHFPDSVCVRHGRPRGARYERVFGGEAKECTFWEDERNRIPSCEEGGWGRAHGTGRGGGGGGHCP